MKPAFVIAVMAALLGVSGTSAYGIWRALGEGGLGLQGTLMLVVMAVFALGVGIGLIALGGVRAGTGSAVSVRADREAESRPRLRR